jgi:prepilin peptidase CpaA
MLHYTLMIVFPLIVAYAALTDFFTMTISNKVSIALIIGFCGLAPLTGMTWQIAGMSLVGATIVLTAGFACFTFGWIGGGDVKFASAVVLWLGWSHLLDYFVLFSFYGGLLTIAALSLNRLLEPLPILQIGFLGRFSEHRRVPYGIALSVAALQIYPTTSWILHGAS